MGDLNIDHTCCSTQYVHIKSILLKSESEMQALKACPAKSNVIRTFVQSSCHQPDWPSHE